MTSVRMRNLFLIYSLEINVFGFAKTYITVFKIFPSRLAIFKNYKMKLLCHLHLMMALSPKWQRIHYLE